MKTLLVIAAFIGGVAYGSQYGFHLPALALKDISLGHAAHAALGAPPSGCHTRGSGLFALPDRRCSPGALNPAVTQATVHSTICKSGYTKTIRPPQSVTGPEKIAEMKAYGIDGSLHDYELDHLISLELGGAANSYKNYFPELNDPAAHGFYKNPKDVLEGVLKHRICDGRMSLRAAQHAIATNWAAAYRRYG